MQTVGGNCASAAKRLHTTRKCLEPLFVPGPFWSLKHSDGVRGGGVTSWSAAVSLEASSCLSSSSCCSRSVFCSSRETRSRSNCCSSSCGPQQQKPVSQRWRVGWTPSLRPSHRSRDNDYYGGIIHTKLKKNKKSHVSGYTSPGSVSAVRT